MATFLNPVQYIRSLRSNLKSYVIFWRKLAIYGKIPLILGLWGFSRPPNTRIIISMPPSNNYLVAMVIIDTGRLTPLFRPISLLGQEQITLYRCLPTVQSRNGGIRSGKALLRHTKGTKETAKKNAQILDAALSELTCAHENGESPRLIVPVNTHALVGKDETSSIVSLFRRVDPDIRKSIIVELLDFPKTLTLELLEDSLIPLFPFVDTFIAQPEPGMKDYTVFANCNLFGVSIDFGDLPSDPSQTKKLTKFWSNATKCRLNLFVQGINSDEIVKEAKRYEALGMDGPIIGSDLGALSS